MFPYKPYRSSLHVLPKTKETKDSDLYLLVTLIIFYQQKTMSVNLPFSQMSNFFVI